MNENRKREKQIKFYVFLLFTCGNTSVKIKLERGMFIWKTIMKQ